MDEQEVSLRDLVKVNQLIEAKLVSRHAEIANLKKDLQDNLKTISGVMSCTDKVVVRIGGNLYLVENTISYSGRVPTGISVQKISVIT